jgi:hypothetical protein
MFDPEPAELRQGVGGDGVIGEAAGDPDGLVCYRGVRGVVAEVIEQVAARGESPGPGGQLGVGSLEQAGERLEDFAAGTAGRLSPGRLIALTVICGSHGVLGVDRKTAEKARRRRWRKGSGA